MSCSSSAQACTNINHTQQRAATLWLQQPSGGGGGGGGGMTYAVDCGEVQRGAAEGTAVAVVAAEQEVTPHIRLAVAAVRELRQVVQDATEPLPCDLQHKKTHKKARGQQRH